MVLADTFPPGQSFLLEGVTGLGLLSPIIDEATVVYSGRRRPLRAICSQRLSDWAGDVKG